MLHCAKTYHHATHGEPFGVTARDVAYDYARVREHTTGVLEKLRKGIGALMKKNNVDVVKGAATITGRTTVEVDGETYEGENLLICTGSRPAMPPIEGLEGNDKVITNDSFLALEEMPEHLVVIGAGIIGTEFSCIYSTVGRQVTVLEMLDQICNYVDRECARSLQKDLEKRGVDFRLSATVKRVEGATVTFENKKGEEESVRGDLVLVATGRALNVEGLGLETIGVDVDPKRGIQVDEHARTNVPNVYAAGDVTGHWLLAHFASRQASVAVSNMFGEEQICREEAVPSVVYTLPEVAYVGLTEAMAKERNIPVKTAKFPLSNNGMFLAETSGERGFVKAVIGEEHGQILGLHMYGPGVGEMIGAAAVMIETELRARDARELIFPHPTIAEAMRDVMSMVD
jgi:dihydrolipoamide dehydrogenase